MDDMTKAYEAMRIKDEADANKLAFWPMALAMAIVAVAAVAVGCWWMVAVAWALGLAAALVVPVIKAWCYWRIKRLGYTEVELERMAWELMAWR